jgi:hypothetical protein
MPELNLQNPNFLEIVSGASIDENCISVEIFSPGKCSTELTSLNKIFDPVQTWSNHDCDDITTFRELRNHIADCRAGL